MINAQQQTIIWQEIRQEAQELVESEPMLASFFHATILKHLNLGSSLSYILANKLENSIMPAIALKEIIEEAYRADPQIILSAACDIDAVRTRDPAVDNAAALSQRLPRLTKLSRNPLFVEARS